MLILIQDDELHLVNQFPTHSTENDAFTSYNLLKYQKSCQKVNRKGVVGHDSCKLFYCKTLSLLSGHFNTATKAWKLRLYHLDSEMPFPSWERNSHFTSLVLAMDIKNSIPVSLENGEILVASVLNQEASSRVVLYVFPTSKVSEKNWKAAYSLLTPPRIRTAKYEFQSCVVISDHIYCSLFLPGVGAYIYKFKISSLQQHQKELHNIKSIWPDCTWQTEDPNLQNCFLAVIKEDIIIITFSNIDNKSIMEVKRTISPSVITPAEYKYDFPCVVKVVAASLVHGDQNPWLAMMYHDNKTNKCCIKTFAII